MSTNWLSDASSDRGMASYSKNLHSRFSLFHGGKALHAKKTPPKRTTGYFPLKDSYNSRSETLSSNSSTACDEKFLESQEQPIRPRLAAMLPWLVHAFLLLVALGLFYGSARNYSLAGSSCVKLQSAFSPALPVIEYHGIKFNGSLDFLSEYRGLPSKEIDAAWHRITSAMDPMVVPADVVTKVGKSPNTSVKIDEKKEGGYVFTLEVFHQLHCLNVLRMASFGDHYVGIHPTFSSPPAKLRVHIDHCVEILRQTLQCQSDVGIVTNTWVRGYKHKYEDFNTWHQCRDFDKVLQWGYAQRADVPQGFKIVKPKTGIVELVVPP